MAAPYGNGVLKPKPVEAPKKPLLLQDIMLRPTDYIV